MDNKNLGLTYAYPHLSFDGTTFTAVAMLQDDGTASGVAQSRVGIWQATDGVTYKLVGWIGNTMNTPPARPPSPACCTSSMPTTATRSTRCRTPWT